MLTIIEMAKIELCPDCGNHFQTWDAYLQAHRTICDECRIEKSNKSFKEWLSTKEGAEKMEEILNNYRG